MAARRCVVCATWLPENAIRLWQVPGLQQKVEKDLGKRPDSVSSCDSICEPCRKRIEGHRPEEETAGISYAKVFLPMLGAAVAVIGAPIAVAALGFGAGGIAAGSAAASMMSMSATTGVGAGVVATLQSIGAAGFSLAGNAVLATAGATAGGLLSKTGSGSKKESNQPPENKGRASGDGSTGNDKPPADENRARSPKHGNTKRP